MESPLQTTQKKSVIRRKIFGKDRTQWLKTFHIVDWITILVLVVIGGILTLTVKPYNRYLPQEDSSTGYPVKSDIVPTWALMITTLVGPPIIFGLTQFWYKSRHDFHHACLGLYTAWAITFLLTTIVKLSTGSYRPNYRPGTLDQDLKQSFPSGHSSLSFSSMVFLSLYLAGKFKVFNAHTGSLVLKAIFILSPMYISIFIAISRTIDYHHSFADIISGSLLGAGIGSFSYFLFFPLVFLDNCDLPRKHGCKCEHPSNNKRKSKHHHHIDGEKYNMDNIGKNKTSNHSDPPSILPQ
eukprot:TRINITY_DN125_c0_g1_i3.p1 TRINITY_DN125_c0_g1~~TRINITY_DN125_c0_g1_i3.p1  ORF type:complete len:296 (-),score=66.50 TRINITY_DN125_c0_g1_i3:105-992(-)